MIDQRILEFIDLKSLSVDIIELLHRFYSYRDISTMINIPPSMLSRYLRRHSHPSKPLALRIVELFIKNSKIKEKIANLVKENPDILYEKIVSNTLSLLALSENFETLTQSDIILAFNDPSIALAMKLRDLLNKKLVVLYFAPIVPASRIECFSIIQVPINVFVCTRYDILRPRIRSALLTFPLAINVEALSTVVEKVKDALRIKNITPLIVLCKNEFKKHNKAICLL